MKFLLDNNLSQRLIPILAEHGWDVIHVRDIDLRDAEDEAVLADFRCNEVRQFDQLVVLGVSRPGNAMSNAFRAGFHRITHRVLPRPVGSRERVTR